MDAPNNDGADAVGAAALGAAAVVVLVTAMAGAVVFPVVASGVSFF